MKYLTIKNQDYGPLLPLIKNQDVTDINWNGKHLWVDDIDQGRYLYDLQLEPQFVNVFSQKIANSVNENFNKYYPLLEAETDQLRISILHESITNSGFSISIRKTPPIRKINEKSILNGYCPVSLDIFMQACIKARFSTIICGIPGTGKTEYLKYLTKFIDDNERIITVEDNIEIRLGQISPKHDCIEIKVDEDLSYGQAIKMSLRQRPDWLLLSEARSEEVKYLLESVSIGTGCMTTIHAGTVESIPDRIMNMLPNDGKNHQNDIYAFFDVGVLIERTMINGKINRRIKSVGIFNRYKGQNKVYMIYQNYHFVKTPLPQHLLTMFKENQIPIPNEKLKYEK